MLSHMKGVYMQQAAELESQIVTAHTLAKIYKMAVSSVYRSAASGAIPSFSTGPGRTGVRFELAEVREALRRTANGKNNEAVSDI